MLELTLKRKWFDMVASGEKKEEYRNPNSWILSRLENKDYQFVRFRNGYSPNAPVCVCKFNGWYYGFGKEEWGGEASKDPYIIIKLGDVVLLEKYKVGRY